MTNDGVRDAQARRRLGARVVVAAALVAAMLAPAQAHATYQGSLCEGLGSWPIQSWSSYNSTWETPMNTARNTWNTSALLNIYHNSSTTSSVTAASYSATWYGYYTYTSSSRRKFIQMNTRTITADATNFANFVRSVFAHELGHGFCLKDDPTTSSASLMKHSRNRNTLVAPTTYDWADINAHF
ncbi:hypothetical protein ACFQRL_14300 [Microbacterium fluvii]|uniref:Peptidase M10 metallopeptidase domain-containing protein n=1 Tax=Microbacterium fluvii TaxID=415215 RepID=A0ABW2HGA9_9MICO|nr:hypothetical protein [Microbacterium fluvii]MCU4673762.1 hypothetical protein [Microbacterium fluvii]